MTEPARSMAASLANLEAHRTDRSSALRAGSARSYLDQAQGELSKLRADILDAELEWKRERAKLQARYDDDIAKLNGEFGTILTTLTDMARRIQATRE
jgi:hypothetical protein